MVERLKFSLLMASLFFFGGLLFQVIRLKMGIINLHYVGEFSWGEVIDEAPEILTFSLLVFIVVFLWNMVFWEKKDL